MRTDRRSLGDTRSIISVGHLLVGSAALVFAGVLIKAGLSPDAELEGVLIAPGLALALAAGVFTCTAVVALRRAHHGRGGPPSIALSVVELALGIALAVAVVVAVQGYGAFTPWRSPLLLPAVVTVALGLAGCRVEVLDHRTSASPH